MSYFLDKTRQSVAVQREGGIPVGKKIIHPYQEIIHPYQGP